MENTHTTIFIESRKKDYVKILCNLIKAKTVNPPGDEYLAAKIIKKRLSKIGVKYKVYEKKKKRSNVVAKIGNENGRKILIATHLDVVPAGEGWETDPFDPVIKDEIIYGRGACDNKGQATSTLLVLEYLKSIEKKLVNQYIFVFAADEEQGSTLGIRYLLRENIIFPDYAIIVDVSGEMKYVTVAEKGVLNLKVNCKGKQAHGSTPNKGISAIANMSKFISKLDHHILKHELHRHLSRPTINFGTIKGGSAPNTVAASCEVVLNIRYIPSMNTESIIDELKKLSERFGEFNFEKLAHLPPTEVDDNNFLVQTILKVTEKHNLKTKPKGLNGATDTKAFVLNDIPAVGFDFADSHVAHNANEYCKLDMLFNFCDVLIDVCMEFENQRLN
ncbi:ArgE/DapE family deacylase [Candidatus Woesearchaeota archaeon]|nr:ArgE/DapE family deacylase [Candidatus Woesearchaeota archaeon]